MLSGLDQVGDGLGNGCRRRTGFSISDTRRPGADAGCIPAAASHEAATNFASSQEIFSVLFRTNPAPLILPSNWIGHWHFLKPRRSSSDSKLRS